jgi:hypothetical protein
MLLETFHPTVTHLTERERETELGRQTESQRKAPIMHKSNRLVLIRTKEKHNRYPQTVSQQS